MVVEPRESAAPKGDAAPCELVTRDGVALHVTYATPADVGELEDFFSRVSPEDLRFRFFASVDEIGEDRLAALTDGDRMTTFLARNAENTLVAVATLTPEPGSHNAEVAVSVHADWKHRGISWTLLDHVLTVAKALGFESASSLEAGANRDAIRLEREMGFVVRLTSAAPVEMLASKKLSD